MGDPQAFFVVGHENWGKSETLHELMGGSHHVRKALIGGRSFVIWRMSNDDVEEDWVKKIRRLDPNRNPHVVLTVCPKREAMSVLSELRKKYALFFWVMRRSYTEDRVIPPAEEQQLRRLGVVEVFSDRAEARVRAAEFRRFIELHP